MASRERTQSAATERTVLPTCVAREHVCESRWAEARKKAPRNPAQPSALEKTIDAVIS